MSTLKIISIGGGWVVNSRHIPALKQSGKFDVIGVVSNDEARAKVRLIRRDGAFTIGRKWRSKGW